METNNRRAKREGEELEKGFLKIPHELLHALLVIGLTGRELKVCSLIYRLSKGCQKEWTKIIPADFKAIGIGDSHIKEILKVLSLEIILIQNEKTKELKLNTSKILSIAERKYPDRLERISDLIHKQLKKRTYQKGNIGIPKMVGENLPKEEITTYQNSNPQPLPKREISALYSKGFSTPKDILNTIINSDKYKIADKNLSTKEDPQDD